MINKPTPDSRGTPGCCGSEGSTAMSTIKKRVKIISDSTKAYLWRRYPSLATITGTCLVIDVTGRIPPWAYLVLGALNGAVIPDAPHKPRLRKPLGILSVEERLRSAFVRRHR